MRQRVEPIEPRAAISILVAEDDQIIRTLFHAIIRKIFPDVAVHLAEDGRAGVELFNTYAPQIVITDINMPGMNGIQLARAIRSLEPATRIIVISAYDEAEFCKAFDEIGVDDYLVKPIALEKLVAAIERCIAQIAPAS